VGEAGLVEVVDATWTRFTTYLQTLQNTINQQRHESPRFGNILG